MAKILIKIGGSVLTDKTVESGHFRRDHLEKLAEILAEIAKSEEMTLVLGAGSFGHPLAKKYGLKNGLVRDEHGDWEDSGARETHKKVLELVEMVMEVLAMKGIKCERVSPMEEFLNAVVEVEKVLRVCAKSVVPVLHGDLVWDEVKGVRIMSGDEILIELGRTMKVDKMIFLTNGDGVMDTASGSNFAVLRREELNKLIENLPEVVVGIDVTGGFLGKLQKCLKYIPACGIRIVDGNDLSKAKSGLKNDQGGTLILP